MKKIGLPENYMPSEAEADWFIEHWSTLPNYYNQEKALDKLFIDMFPKNNTIEEVLIKCAALNDFYSTHVFDIHTMSQHILSLHIDERLSRGDITLVGDIANLRIGGKPRLFYSFATKYCSHHRPLSYSIYDNYVDKVLVNLQKRDHFSEFGARDLKNYSIYMRAIRDFKNYYKLEQYNLKQLDQYLWQLGKKYYSLYE